MTVNIASSEHADKVLGISGKTAERYAAKVIEARATGAANPTVAETHPEINPAQGWYRRPRKLYSPPDRGKLAPSSAYVRAPQRAVRPPINQSIISTKYD